MSCKYLLCVCLRADDYAPPGAKSKWLAAFYLCIPVGYALVRTFPCFGWLKCLDYFESWSAAGLTGCMQAYSVSASIKRSLPVSCSLDRRRVGANLRDGKQDASADSLYVGFVCDIGLCGLLQGYIFGGVVAGPLGWRAAFLLEAAAMVPFVLFCALAPPMNLKGMETGMSLQSSSCLSLCPVL